MKDRLLVPLLAVCLLATGTVCAQEIVLQRDTNIAIETEGKMGNAGPALKDLLAKYLLRALKRDRLEAGGKTVRFVIKSKAVDWQDMRWDKGLELGQLNACEIRAGEMDTICITGETALATGFGIVDFLEKYLNVVWAFPGELGICVPEQDELRLKIVTETVSPVFVSRFQSGLDDNVTPEYARVPNEGITQDHRDFFRTDDCIKSLRLQILAMTNHTMIQTFPVKESKEKYPEIFPIKDGKPYIPPEGSITWHPCYTNPKTIEIATRKAVEHFRNGGLYFSLGVNDGNKVQCQCPQCQALGFPDSYYHFVAAVAENVKEYYPPHVVTVLAYGDVTYPPERLVLPDNVIVFATASKEVGNGTGLLRWKSHARNIATYEYLPGENYWFPNFPFRILQRNIQFFRDANVKCYWVMAYPMWAFDGPKMYLYSHLLWNPDLDMDAALSRYCTAAFGRAGEPMARFYKRWASVRDKDLVADGVSTTWSYEEYRRPDKQFARCTAEDYQYTAACLEEAKKAADNPKARQRLEMVGAFFEYSKTLFEALQVKKEVFEFAEDKNWPELSSRAFRLWRTRQDLLALFKNHPEWFLGTRCTLDYILSTQWEGDDRWTINYELANAVTTALFEVNRHGLVKQLDGKAIPSEFRPALAPYTSEPAYFTGIVGSYGYYDRDLYQLMTNFVTAKGLSFKTNPAVSWKLSKGAENGLKQGVFAGTVRLDRKSCYLFDFGLTGQDGKLMLRVMNEDAGGKMVWLESEFKRAGERQTKRMLLQPDPGNPSANPVWNVEIVFTPNSEEARFDGFCAITKMDFKKPDGN